MITICYINKHKEDLKTLNLQLCYKAYQNQIFPKVLKRFKVIQSCKKNNSVIKINLLNKTNHNNQMQEH